MKGGADRELGPPFLQGKGGNPLTRNYNLILGLAQVEGTPMSLLRISLNSSPKIGQISNCRT